MTAPAIVHASTIRIAGCLLWPALSVGSGLAHAATAHATSCTIYVRAEFVPAAGIVADGTTPATAFASIAVAATQLRNPGDVVCVGPGLYREGNITPARSGISAFPIEFHADPSGVSTGDPPGPVVIVGPPNVVPGLDPTAGFRLLGQRHIVIDGFEIEGFFDAGIQVRSAVDGTQASDVTVRNNTVRLNAKTGIDINGEGLFVLEGNRVVGNGTSGISIRHCPTDPDDALASPRCRAASTTTLRPVVSNNHIGINGAHGLLLRDTDEALVQNTVVYSNRAKGISALATRDAVFLNNLVYANGQSGVAIGTADLASPNAVVANNTLYANGSWGIEIGSVNAASPGALVLHNIVSQNGGGDRGIGVLNETAVTIRSTCGYVAGFNLIDDSYGPKTPWNVYDLRAGPKFVAPVEGPDGILGGYLAEAQLVDGSDDDSFYLRQRTGNADRSPAVDAGAATVEAFGLTGSTARDGQTDLGAIDIGYHYGASPGQVVTIAPPFMPLYVRATGNDGAKGKHAYDAFRTIRAAAFRARAGVTVVVGPGVYRECDLGPPPDQGLAAFVADTTGEQTRDRPGRVLVDAGCCRTDPGPSCAAGETGFNLANACRVVVDGFHVRGATDDAIQVQTGSHWAAVRNNVLFSNQKRGIAVVNSDDVGIVNNLVYDNGAGIQIGGACRTAACSEAGSRRARVEHNTCYANGYDGLLVGAGPGASTHARIAYNILDLGSGENGRRGKSAIQLGSNSTSAAHVEGYDAAFNVIVGARYGAGTPRPVTDRVDAPLFVNPSGYDGVLGGDGFADDSFQLQQRAGGDPAQSPAVDFSDVTAVAAGLGERTTSSDGSPDDGRLDVGFHYPGGWRRPPASGDCNNDGRVTIDELVVAVRIALGDRNAPACANADADGDGRVSIDELTQAVRVAIRG